MSTPVTGSPILDALRVEEKILIKKGFVPISPWWSAVLTRFLRTTALMFVARVGRQGGKSTTMSRIATAIGVFVDHKIPPGSRGVVAFVSVKRSDAQERLLNIAANLDALGVKYTRTQETIELVGRPIIYQVYAASFRTAVGMVLVALFGDEMARWRDDDAGANPASEVVASMMPAGVTQPMFRAFFVSSPFGTLDHHAELFARGDTEHQQVAQASSWEANPTLSIERTHALEPIESMWSREYAAIPSAARNAVFDAEWIARAFTPPKQMAPSYGSIGVIDASSGKGDAYTYGVCAWRECDGVKKLVFELVDGFEGAFYREKTLAQIVGKASIEFKSRRAFKVVGDQRESLGNASEFQKRQMTFTSIPWTAPGKEGAVTALRRLFADGSIVLPEHKKLRAELHAFEEQITASGSFTYKARLGGHDDYVALLVTAMMATAQGLVPGGPGARLTMREALNARAARDEHDRAWGIFNDD